MLSDSAKYTVLRSQLHRFDNNTTMAADFVANAIRLGSAMFGAGYRLPWLKREVERYTSWDSSKGRWSDIKRRVLDAFDRWTRLS